MRENKRNMHLDWFVNIARGIALTGFTTVVASIFLPEGFLTGVSPRNVLFTAGTAAILVGAFCVTIGA